MVHHTQSHWLSTVWKSLLVQFKALNRRPAAAAAAWPDDDEDWTTIHFSMRPPCKQFTTRGARCCGFTIINSSSQRARSRFSLKVVHICSQQQLDRYPLLMHRRKHCLGDWKLLSLQQWNCRLLAGGDEEREIKRRTKIASCIQVRCWLLINRRRMINGYVAPQQHTYVLDKIRTGWWVNEWIGINPNWKFRKTGFHLYHHPKEGKSSLSFLGLFCD